VREDSKIHFFLWGFLGGKIVRCRGVPTDGRIMKIKQQLVLKRERSLCNFHDMEEPPTERGPVSMKPGGHGEGGQFVGRKSLKTNA